MSILELLILVLVIEILCIIVVYVWFTHDTMRHPSE